MFRRTFALCQFNIVKIESLAFPPLTDINVPISAWPLLNLPSDKLSVLRRKVEIFRRQPFVYLESFYSNLLWYPFLSFLFERHFVLETEFDLSRIEPEYRRLCVDFVVIVDDFAPPTVFIELARDHLVNSNVNHKDEDKIAFSMGASFLRLMRLNRNKGQEFLKQLRVYGILGGGSDFDLCQIYVVFPDAENDEDFYFVFDSSMTLFRYKMLEYNSLSANQRLTDQQGHVMHADRQFRHPATTDLRVGGLEITDETDELLNELFFSDFHRDAHGQPPNVDARLCRSIVSEGHINDHALQVLEKLVELVQIQAELLVYMGDDPGPNDSKYKYDESRIELMLESQSAHTKPSPFLKKNKAS